MHVTACEKHVGLVWLKSWGHKAALDGGQGINFFPKGQVLPDSTVRATYGNSFDSHGLTGTCLTTVV